MQHFPKIIMEKETPPFLITILRSEATATELREMDLKLCIRRVCQIVILSKSYLNFLIEISLLTFYEPPGFPENYESLRIFRNATVKIIGFVNRNTASSMV